MVDFVIPIYRESSKLQYALLQDCIESALRQNTRLIHHIEYELRIQLVFVYDKKDTPETLLQFCRIHHPQAIFYGSDSGCKGWAGSVKYMEEYYAQSTADFIILNQSDDRSHPDRCVNQIEGLLKQQDPVNHVEKYCTVAVCDYYRHEVGMSPVKDTFRIDKDTNLLNCGYPSCWAFWRANRPEMGFQKMIDVMKNIATMDSKDEILYTQAADTDFLMNEMLFGDGIMIVKKPLVHYHIFPNSCTSKIVPEEGYNMYYIRWIDRITALDGPLPSYKIFNYAPTIKRPSPHDLIVRPIINEKNTIILPQWTKSGLNLLNTLSFPNPILQKQYLACLNKNDTYGIQRMILDWVQDPTRCVYFDYDSAHALNITYLPLHSPDKVSEFKDVWLPLEKELQANVPTIQYNMTRKKILCIGLFRYQHHFKEMVNLIAQNTSYEIIRVAIDLTQHPQRQYIKNWTIEKYLEDVAEHGLDYFRQYQSLEHHHVMNVDEIITNIIPINDYTQVRGQEKKILMKYLCDCFQPDLIFLGQNSFALDFEGVSTPIAYWATEILWPRLPYNANLVGFLDAYFGCWSQHYNAHTYEMKRIKHHEKFLYGINTKQHVLTCGTNAVEVFQQYVKKTTIAKRYILLGFMGALKSDNGDLVDGDYIETHIRDQRDTFTNGFMEHLKKHHSALAYQFVMKPKSTDILYTQFLLQCRFVINCASDMGQFNERELHASYCGAILVQYKHPCFTQVGHIPVDLNCFTPQGERVKSLDDVELIEKAQKEKWNCFGYSTYQDLVKIMQIGLNPNAETFLEHIRLQGIEFALTQTYEAKIKALIAFLARVME